MRCNKCGNEVADDMIYCNKCGNKLNNGNESNYNYKVYNVGQTNFKPKKKIGKGLIIVIICCLILIGSAIYIVISSRDSNSEDVGNGVSNNYSNIPEDEILKKWQATLPLNSTNGLEKVIYDSNSKELYLKYNMGICIVDTNNEINRYVQGDYEYYTADYIFNNSVEGNGIIIMTPSEFKQIIGEE